MVNVMVIIVAFHWGAGDGIFRFADPARCEYEYQYSHRKYEYHDEYIAEKTEQALSEQDDEWTTPNRFWSNGHDFHQYRI